MWRLEKLGTLSALFAVMALERPQEWLFRAGFACPMASFIARTAVPGRFCPPENSAPVGLRRSTRSDRSYGDTL
jgi:hypothetical protein